MEAILRYEQGLLPRPMKLCVENLLDLDPKEDSELLTNSSNS